MPEKCPYCYRNLGTWQKDPILIPTGAKYDWISDTELIYEPDIDNRWYKGIDQISESEVQEIQDTLRDLEHDNLSEIDWTVFSPLNTSGRFQITGKHIKEMRDSVEKLLEFFGLEKKDYFNYDEEGNHIIHPLGDKIEWTDPITKATDLQKFQVKAIHIEDLRHFIQILWKESWDVMSLQELHKALSGAPRQNGNQSFDFIGDMSNFWTRTWSWVGGSDTIYLISDLTLDIIGNKNWLFSCITNNECWCAGGFNYASGGSLLLNLNNDINRLLKIESKKLYFNMDLNYSFGGNIGGINYEPPGEPHPPYWHILSSPGGHPPPPSYDSNEVYYNSFVYLQIYLSNGKEIVYYDQMTNKPDGTSIPNITIDRKRLKVNMINFNRCLWDDFKILFGVEPSTDTKIAKITVKCSSTSYAAYDLIKPAPGDPEPWWPVAFLYKANSSMNLVLDLVKVLYL